MKVCRTCGRAKHTGLCDMATLEDDTIVHVSRIGEDGKVNGLRVKNRWIKPEQIKKKKARRS